ncbi:hypothetical protein KSS87_001674 [Heliosperma pusillum]|nr:hypothetical protein KSS87_001674 [Heliosperma pusillum]
MPTGNTHIKQNTTDQVTSDSGDRFGIGITIQHNEHSHDHLQSHSSSHHMDQSTLVFFTLNDLKQGKTLPVYFRGNNPSNSPQFLPRDEADSLPFSLSKLDFLLQYFGFGRGSSQATAMENTLRECEVKPIKGETKFCATSLESMLDFVHEMIGVNIQVQVLNTQNLEKSTNNVLQNYTIVDEPREVPAPKMVACHTMPYPYVIYYCHYQKSESKVFQVPLQGETRNKNKNKNKNDVEAVAVCHMDTSQWSESHVSFKVLGIKPGSSPVCHFFPADNLVWVPLSNIHMGVENQLFAI